MFNKSSGRAVAVGALVMLFSIEANAGLVPMPLEAELDLAKMVVVGKITDITKVTEGAGHGETFGRATVAVSEPLKGTTAKEVTMLVVMHRDSSGPVGAASPARIFVKGEEGIFVITSDGRPSHAYGFLRKKQLDEVKAALTELDKRTWSDEVGGVKAWAGAVTEGAGDGRSQRILFCVRNVSKSTIWLPRSMYKEVVTAVARDSAGKEFRLSGFGQSLEAKTPVTCRPLETQQTRYMHPDSEDHAYIVVPNDLPPGKYTVTVSLGNDRDGEAIGNREPKKIDAWKGRLVAPSFTLEIPKASTTQPETR